jgi:hypothetical protein
MMKSILFPAVAAALLAACAGDGAGTRLTPGDLSATGSTNTFRRDTYDDRGLSGSSTGRATILHQDRPGGSDYDPGRSDLGRDDGWLGLPR